MPELQVKGRTIRSLLRNVYNVIEISNVNQIRYSSLNRDASKSDVQQIAYNLIHVLSGGEPIQLISDMLDIRQKMQIEPLQTV